MTTTRKAILAGVAGTICVTAVAVAMARRADDRSDAKLLIEVLELKPGSVVAEIGAGDGEITVLIADHVGETGRVYTTELGDERVGKLRAAVEKAGTANVTVLDAHAARTNLPERCCDAIFMRSVYHHFEDPPVMNRSLWDSLRPGGRLAIIDFTPPPGAEAATPAGRDEDGHHGVTPDTVVAELTTTGFERVAVEQRDRRGFLVVVRKPL